MGADSGSGLFQIATSALAGGVIGFLLAQIGHVLVSILDRQKKGYNALIRLQKHCQDGLVTTDGNIEVVRQFLEMVSEESLGRGAHQIFMHEFFAYDIDHDLVLSLTNLDLMNELYSVNIDLRLLNLNMSILNRAYTHSLDGFLRKDLAEDDYRVSIMNLRSRYSDMVDLLSEVRPRLIRLLARVNLESQSPPVFVRLITKAGEKKSGKEPQKALENEVRRLERDIYTMRRSGPPETRE